MFEFIFMGVIGSLLIALTSMLCYEMLRFSWYIMPKLTIHPRLRAVIILIPIFLTHIACIWMYAGVIYYTNHYTKIGGLSGEYYKTHVPDFLASLHYSASVYTTIGFGDIAPLNGLRMLAGVEALNGLVLIGWTVSFTYLAMEKFWDMPHRSLRK